MADNVAISAGIGTTIATDDVSGVHYQFVKLVDGTLDSTNKATVSTTGGLRVEVINHVGVTRYAGSSAAFASATSATDIATITGSGTKTVRVMKAWLAGTQTTAGTITALLLKRSTANTAGAASASTAVPVDSNNASATATLLAYTANPTTGSLVGNVRSNKLFVPAPATAAGQPIWYVDFVDNGNQGLVLRGVAQVLAFNLASTTVTGGSFTAGFEWTEE